MALSFYFNLAGRTEVSEKNSLEQSTAIHRESNEQDQFLTEQGSDAIFLVDADGRIFKVNKKAEDLLGYTMKELLRMRYTQLHPQEGLEYAINSFQQMVADNRAYAKDVIMQRKDGKEIPVDITATLIDHDGRKIIRGSIRDVTERKKCEDELREAKGMLEQQVQERTAELIMKNRQLEADMEERKTYEQRLQTKRRKLEQDAKQLTQLNAALKVLLKQRDTDKREVEEKILLNVKELVLPHLEKMKKRNLDQKSLSDLKIMEANLNNIISSFTHKLLSKFIVLTPKEIQIANMIREGRATKEIAEIMSVSLSAIKLHRYHIRNKLGLIDQKVNLRSYLFSLQ